MIRHDIQVDDLWSLYRKLSEVVHIEEEARNIEITGKIHMHDKEGRLVGVVEGKK